RLGKIMAWTRDFHRVVITCRTQFFPRDEEIPVETGIIKVGPRGAGEGPQFTFYKIYLSPFSDEQVQDYLKRRFPFWQRNRRRAACEIVKKIPNLAVRPMLLTYVDDLIGSGKTFENAYQIYTEMVDAWLERERKHVEDKDALREFSDKLAIDLFLNREKRGGERIPYREIAPLAQKFDIKLATWQLTGRSLLNRDAEGNYKFAHRSILEFLVAQKVHQFDKQALQIERKLWTEQARKFLEEGFDNTCWQKVVSYLREHHYDAKFLATLNIFIRFDHAEIKEAGDSKKVIKTRKTFEISTHPVTNREFEAFDPSHKTKRDSYSDQDDQPVVNVSWEEATQYCAWLSEQTGERYRLPTEAEWKYAASGGGKRQYPWGAEKPTPEHANYRDSNLDKTTPVGAYPAGMTPEGLFDMAGNVWEWCADWYDESKDGRVVRGGAFFNLPDGLRCAYRYGVNPLSRDDSVGFRFVRGA
ncbi:SUMF1/EgtB/PvdO family nonheme iron enzyme, partial [candidate division KSB1 bacterium]|nr:SUMF1/EgtB/PvdO family nonheme iron enzyme [candidate division KSB1 bacterium]